MTKDKGYRNDYPYSDLVTKAKRGTDKTPATVSKLKSPAPVIPSEVPVSSYTRKATPNTTQNPAKVGVIPNRFVNACRAIDPGSTPASAYMVRG